MSGLNLRVDRIWEWIEFGDRRMKNLGVDEIWIEFGCGRRIRTPDGTNLDVIEIEGRRNSERIWKWT